MRHGRMANPHSLLQSRSFALCACLFAVVSPAARAADAAPKRVLLIAGKKSHGPGEHEYEKGAEILARCLESSAEGRLAVEVHRNGWPEDASVLDKADTIFLFCDGADRDEKAHPLLEGDRLAALGRQMRRGCGLAVLHYTVFVPARRGGAEYLDWVGGYFDYESGPPDASGRRWYSRIGTHTLEARPGTPTHPISRGLEAFRLREEFYYRMRFREPDPRRVPILLAPLPGEAEPQVVAWAVQREDGGRGFAFTGGHFHDNWQVAGFRRLVLNALLWTAQIEVPDGGFECDQPPPAAPPPAGGRFGGGLEASRSAVLVDGREEYRHGPITIECWAKLRSKQGFNVLVSSDPKHSSTHWELYSYAGTGAFSLYIPGHSPSEIKSETDITDGEWHHLAVTGDSRDVHLYVDGKEVKVAEIKNAEGVESVPGHLSIGMAVDRGGNIGCDGWIDEVRISQALRPLERVPAGPLEADADTVGLWRFDGEGDARLADASSRKAQARWFDPREVVPTPPTRWELMDVGPFLSATVRFPGGIRPTYKALAIRLGEKDAATVCFDTELLRMSAGWTGGFLNMNPSREGLAGPPAAKGEIQFTSPPLPGWSTRGSFEDPRPKRRGPLPREYGRFNGLYLHGRQVVLSYSVGGVDVLELPGFETHDGQAAFTRTFRVAPSETRLRLLAATAGRGAIAIKDDADRLMARTEVNGRFLVARVYPSGTADLALDDNRLVVTLPPRPIETRFKLVLGSTLDVNSLSKLFPKESAPLPDLRELTRGGPPRWGPPLETRGSVDRGPGPFAVDTLAAPFENPWKALLFLSGHDFLPSGEAAVSTVHGDVWIVSGIDEKLEKLSWKRFATGLFQPLGLRVRDGLVHVLGRDQITRLHDRDGDREADFYENVNNDCQVTEHGHEYATNLETGPSGDFYFTKCTNEGRSDHDGSLLRVTADGSRLEVVATGFRNPNGMSVSPTGVITDADQEGTWMPATRLDLIREGGFYGYMPAHHRPSRPATYDLPLCWIPREIDNSAGGQVWVPDGVWGPLAGRLLHLSYGKCHLFLVLTEEVDGVPQGGLVRVPVQFASGAMRARFRPNDGHLYVTGLHGWQTSGPLDGALQRVRRTGAPLGLPLGLQARKNGVLLEFSEPLERGRASDPESYAVEIWNYRWTEEYGSKDWSVADPNRVGRDALPVRAARLSSDGTSVFLEVEGLKPVMQMRVRWRLRATDGRRLQQEMHSTIHRLGPAWEPK